MKHVTQLKVFFAGELVGYLTWQQRQYWFQYDAYWLQNGFNLAPELMNFTATPQLAKSPIFQGLPGVFYNSLPDGWGMLLMDRYFKKNLNWERHEITPLDRLAYLGKRALGALEYEPQLSQNELHNDTIDLILLAKNAEHILNGKPAEILQALNILGGSPGGARPKVTVGLADRNDHCIAGQEQLPKNYSHWLVKFRGQDDPKDMANIENTYNELARLAGLIVPATRLIYTDYDTFFASKRFDREGDTKFHLLTLSGYLYADHRVPSLDYNALLASTAILTKDVRQLQQAFRLMVFNIATHNKDDHAKNFAFISDRNGHWSLAPAYDLTFSSGMNNEHTTAINGSGNPTRRDIAKIAKEHNILHWEEILADVLAAVKKLVIVAKKNKVSKASLEKISAALELIRQRLIA